MTIPISGAEERRGAPMTGNRFAARLSLIRASRSSARIGPAGEPILLFEQNRARWDRLLIRRGLAALDRA